MLFRHPLYCLSYRPIIVKRGFEPLSEGYRPTVLPLNYPTCEGHRTRTCISGFVAQCSVQIILTLHREGRIRTYVYMIRSHVRHPGYATPPNCRRDSHPLMLAVKAQGLGYFVFSSMGGTNRDGFEPPPRWLTANRSTIKLPAPNGH